MAVDNRPAAPPLLLTLGFMRLRMTIVDPTGSGAADVDVVGGPGTTAAELRSRIAPAPAAGDVLHVDGRPVPDHATLGLPPLLDGATLRVGPRSRRARGRDEALRVMTCAGPDAGRSVPLPMGTLTIGRGHEADLALDDTDLSRAHLELHRDGDGVVARDLGSTNGTHVDGTPGHTARVVTTDSVIDAGSTRLRIGVRSNRSADARATGEGTLEVTRGPNLARRPDPVTLTLPAPPSEPTRNGIPWFTALLPLPLSAVMAIFIGPTMLLFGLMSPVMLLGSWGSDRVGRRRKYREEMRKHAAAVAEVDRRATSALSADLRDRERRLPDAVEVLARATGPSASLWCQSSEDLLVVRIGTGTVPSNVSIEHGTSREKDVPRLHRAPVAVDLAAVGVTGLQGHPEAVAGAAAFWLGQLLTGVSPNALQITAVVTDPARWRWLSRAPHLRAAADDPGSARFASVEEAPALIAALRDLSRRRREPEPRSVGGAGGPIHLLVLDGASSLRGDLALAEVLEHGPDVGVHVLACDSAADRLPPGCGAVVALRGTGGAISGPAAPEVASLVPDRVGQDWRDRLGRALAPLRDAEPDRTAGAIPREVHLSDLVRSRGGDPFDATEVLTAWERGPTTAVTVGIDPTGPATLDLRTAGPHALVGGTTGSGKSELLQSWIVALARANRPEDVAFVLVDYKGGAAFGECARLPHTVGMLTDLDPHLAHRALRSLDAELRRRERLLAAVGAASLEEYLRVPPDDRDPLARLVIVVDEFRMLAEDQPEVLDGMVRIAAIGRSLGVHLVLATQRPGGVVSADIRANVNLRIALRVRDRGDSTDVIDAPDAVDIPPTAPGRALVRTATTQLQAFQTLRVGGHGAATGSTELVVVPAGTPVPAPVGEGPSDLVRIVEAVIDAHARSAGSLPHRPWAEPLADCVPVSTERDERADTVAWGVTDEPDEQRHGVLTWTRRADGHTAVIGGAGTGRTTALLTLAGQVARRWGPDEIHLHCLDGGGGLGPLSALPHCGAVVPASDRRRAARLLQRLRAEMADRATRVRTAGFRSVDEWREAWLAGAFAERPPAVVLLLVDGWEQVSRPPEGRDPIDLADQVGALLREGEAAGLRVVIAGDRSVLVGRTGSALRTRLVLDLPDPADRTIAGVPRSSTLARPPAGRAIRVEDGAEVQIGVLGADTSTAGLGRMLASIAAEQPAAVVPPLRVEPMPSTVSPDDLTGCRDLVPLGIGGPEVLPLGLDPDRDGCRWVVQGAPRSGRSTVLATSVQALAAAGRRVVIVLGRSQTPLVAVAGELGIDPIGPDDRDRLVRELEAHPGAAVVVDDAELLVDRPCEAVLRQYAAEADRFGGLVIGAVSTTHATTSLRGFVVDLLRHRTGVVIGATAPSDGDGFGLRLPALDRLPGRAHLIRHGEVDEIQLAAPC